MRGVLNTHTGAARRTGMSDTDWTSKDGRAELRRLHAESTRGDDGWTVTEGASLAYRVVSAGCVVATLDRLAAETDRRNADCIAADHNAVPSLLDALDAREALLRRCAELLGVAADGESGLSRTELSAATALLADLRAAGLAP